MNFNCKSTKKINYNFIRLLPLVLIIMFSLVSSLHAATYSYYFSKGGGGSQCSQSSPCSSISQAQAKINSANSGDTVNLKFRRGDTWTFNTAGGTTLTWGLTVRSTDPTVNIDAYGSGSLPVFDGLVSNFNSVPVHGQGAVRYSRIFAFEKAYCSVKNIEIRRVYGHAIFLKNNGQKGFLLSRCNINRFGNSGIAASTAAQNVIVEYCTFHTGQELYRYYKDGGAAWSGAITLKKEGGTKPIGNIIRHNLVYDIYGEGINVGNAIVEYNVIGDTGSIGICVVPHNWDFEENIVRYNIITHSNWSTSIYDDFRGGSSPVGFRVFDEQNGGDNSKADIQFYGNIIINRSYGIWIFNPRDSAFGSVKIYNNTVIDSHKYNIYVADPTMFNDIRIYNNAFILYDQISTKHALDYRDFLPRSNWRVENNSFWTKGGSPTVDTDWRIGYITSDPGLPGEPSVDWDGQTGPTYYKGINFSDIYPRVGSPLNDSGKILGAGYSATFLTSGTNFSKLPVEATFQISSISGSWPIGAIVHENGTGSGVSIRPPSNLQIISSNQ